MQEEVDEWKLLGQHGTGMHQVPHQCLPTQAGMHLWTGQPRPVPGGYHSIPNKAHLIQ